ALVEPTTARSSPSSYLNSVLVGMPCAISAQPVPMSVGYTAPLSLIRMAAFFCGIVVVLAVTGAAHGQQIIVGWGGDTVSAAAVLNGWASQSSIQGINANPPSRAGRLIVPPGTDSVSLDTSVGIPFSETTQLSPTSGYTGQRFFGGLMSNQLSADNITQAPV